MQHYVKEFESIGYNLFPTDLNLEYRSMSSNKFRATYELTCIFLPFYFKRSIYRDLDPDQYGKFISQFRLVTVCDFIFAYSWARVRGGRRMIDDAQLKIVQCHNKKFMFY